MSSELNWEAEDGRITLNGHIVLVMRLRPGAVPGRSHTASCTLCRARQTAKGAPSSPALGALGFFITEKMADSAVRRHVRSHELSGALVHIVKIPDLEKGVQGG